MPINYDQSGVVYDSTTYTYDGEVFSPSVFPTAGVFIAWNDGPYVANPGWTEITPYVREISIRRGRADDFEQFDTGTAQLVLDNRARTFDPFYTSGPNYLKLTPRRQIRIVAQIGGVNYDVFRGYVAGWPVTWSEAGYDSTVTIQVFDALGLMANEQVPTDWPDYYTRLPSPRHYWKCNDSRTSATLFDTGSAPINMKPTTTDTLPFEVPALADGLLSNGLNFYPCPMWTASAFGQPVTDTSVYDVSLVGWFSFNSVAGAVATWTVYRGYSTVSMVWNYTGGTFAIEIRNATRYTTYTMPLLAQGVGYHIAIVTNANAGGNPSATIYLNGLTGTPGQWSPTATTSGAVASTGGFEYSTIAQISAQELATYDTALTAAQVGAIYSAGIARFSETTTARMNRLIGTTTYPTLLTSFTASPAATVSEIGSGTGVIPEMQLVADSEGGEIYVSKSGLLTTTNRTDVFNATRSANAQATITDSGSGIRYGTDLEIQYDADALKNDVTVNYSGDGEVSATSSAVISAYGASATTIETQLADPTSAQQLALMELGVEGSLVPRISAIDVSANTAAADWQTILGLELLDRVTFKRTPSVGNQFSRDALVNAIEHQIVPGVWRTQLTLSMRYTSPLTCDDDVLGTVDFNYCG